MSLGQYYPTATKTVHVSIITVDPRTRRVEGRLKDGVPIMLAVWDTGSFFRWPREGEEWSAVYESNFWRLGDYVGGGVDNIEALMPGDARVDATNLYISGVTYVNNVKVVLDNDLRLTNTRKPMGPAGGVLAGTYPNPTFAQDMATQAELDASNASSNTALATHEADTTLIHGIADTAALVVTTDPRLSNSRTPTGGAGGVLSGTYPNPGFAVDMATQGELDAHTILTTTAHGGIVANTDPRLADSRTPTGIAGGALSGTYPNPGFAVDMATQAELNTHEADTLSVHGITDTAALVVTTDSRLSDSRTPTGIAGGVLSGTYPNPGFAVDMATQAELDAKIRVTVVEEPALRWVPPVLTTPTTINMSAGVGTYQQLDNQVDYIINLPASPKTTTLMIEGGRNIRIIGGHMAVPDGVGSSACLYFTDNGLSTSGAIVDGRVIHVEGVRIESPPTDMKDGIGLQCPSAVVQIQACRVTGIKGIKSGFHGDVIQHYSAVKELRVDRFYGDTNYQGLFLSPQDGLIGRIHLARVHLVTSGPPAEAGQIKLVHLTKALDGSHSPTSLHRVHVEGGAAGQTTLQCVYPDDTATPPASYDANEDVVTFPQSRGLWGQVRGGAPPEAFAAVGDVGLGYVSPGYRR